jgi:hypothetical protein
LNKEIFKAAMAKDKKLPLCRWRKAAKIWFFDGAELGVVKSLTLI